MASKSRDVDLSPLPVTYRAGRRLTQLVVGLVFYGTSMAMMVRAGLGLSPWDVLHQGLTERLGWSFGAATALTGVAVLLLWLPVRQRPGIGTVLNVLVIALTVNVVLGWLPPARALPLQVSLLLGGVVLNAFATAVYVGVRLGPGPRDGLMTGLHARTGLSLRSVRTGIEIVVLITGWLLGGTAGVGTALYAVAIGPLTQLAMPLVAVRPHRTDNPPRAGDRRRTTGPPADEPSAEID